MKKILIILTTIGVLTASASPQICSYISKGFDSLVKSTDNEKGCVSDRISISENIQMDAITNAENSYNGKITYDTVTAGGVATKKTLEAGQMYMYVKKFMCHVEKSKTNKETLGAFIPFVFAQPIFSDNNGLNYVETVNTSSKLYLGSINEDFLIELIKRHNKTSGAEKRFFTLILERDYTGAIRYANQILEKHDFKMYDEIAKKLCSSSTIKTFDDFILEIGTAGLR